MRYETCRVVIRVLNNSRNINHSSPLWIGSFIDNLVNTSEFLCQSRRGIGRRKKCILVYSIRYIANKNGLE